MEFDKGDVFRYLRWGEPDNWSPWIRRPNGTWMSGLEPSVSATDDDVRRVMENGDDWEYLPHAHQKRLGLED